MTPDSATRQTVPVTPDATAPDPVAAAKAAYEEHEVTCGWCSTRLSGDARCAERDDLFAARRRALTGRAGGPAEARPVCPKCGTAGCLEDKALDW